MSFAFVVPPLDGPITGGTRFNRELVGALRTAGHAVEVRADYAGPGLAWVDSLFSSEVPRWAAAGRVGMVMHWLPSLVMRGEAVPRAELTEEERAVLEAAEAFVVPSPFLAAVLERLGVEAERIGVVEPGVSEVPAVRREHPTTGTLRAVVIANVTAGKGVVELLQALDGLPPDGLALRIIGSLDAEPEVAARARAWAAGRDVVFEGAVAHERCLAMLADSDVLVSASRMESYGMALADARACGVPVLARAGGNVANLVDPHAGGRLVDDARALAHALVELAADPSERTRRRAAAWAGRGGRSWSDAAADFVAFAQQQ